MSNRPRVQKSRRARPQGRSDSGSNPLLKWMIFGVVALVALAVAVGFLASRDAEDRQEHGIASQVADVGFAGVPALPRFDATVGDPAVGKPAPGFAATGFDGIEVSVQPGDGTAKVIGFFAHWCPHCQRELPRIADWLAANQPPAGVEVIAVSTAVDPDGSNYPPSVWFEREGWSAAAVRDSATNEISEAYGLRGFPYTVVVDGAGRVLTRVSGELSDSAWESLLDAAAASAG